MKYLIAVVAHSLGVAISLFILDVTGVITVSNYPAAIIIGGVAVTCCLDVPATLLLKKKNK
jgi:hypothetical protein